MPLRLLLIALLVHSSALFAQTQSPQTVKANIDKYGINNPKESIYLQFDKPTYSPGQTVWFKAYLTGSTGLLNLSKTLYVDFIDEQGAILMHGVYPIWFASAAGGFDLAGAYNGKSIHVRAYTQWMLNFDEAFLYNKDIRVVANTKTGIYPAVQPDLDASLQFFPEGGDCVEGLKSKIAFKANYQNGMPANITGIVIDSKGNVADSIKTMHDGMGFFYLEPAPGETYIAKWTCANSAPYQTQLPEAKTIGVAIDINVRKLGVAFSVARTDNAPEEMKQLHVVATMQQQVVYMAPVNLAGSPMTGGVIPTKQLSSGIMQVTLFDAHWKPLAERIMFINNNDYRFNPVVGLDTLGLTKRGRNVLSIDVPDTLLSNLSVSITDAGLGIDSSGDIVSHLLMTGELKGNVYHPGYYFSSNSDSLAKHLDLVMLTNGWRRYKWYDIIVGINQTVKYPQDTAWLNFSGRVIGATPKQLKNITSLTAIYSQKGKDSTRQYLNVPLDSAGSFSKPSFLFFDTLKVFYKLVTKSDSKLSSTVEINFNSNGITPPKFTQPFKNPFGYLDTTGYYRAAILAVEEAKIKELLKNATLKGVTVTTKVKTKIDLMDEKYAGGLFSSSNAYEFDMVNDPLASKAIDLLNFLTIKVAGLKVDYAPTGEGVIIYQNDPMSVYIDEIPSDYNAASLLNMNDIAYIKVFRAPFLGGYGTYGTSRNGAVAIYRRRGEEAANNPSQAGLLYKLIAGYTALKQFYSPNYGDTYMPTMQEDVRSTLYWNPLIITTPKNHTIKLGFYNNDITSQFRVVVEGISSDGKFARVVKLIQ